MKVIVIGLGNFGSAVAVKLAALGHEVIGVDSIEQRVENIKDKITYAITVDCTDATVIKTLPLQEADMVLVAIGEDLGASILITALLKKYNVKRIVSRAISPIHRTILEAIGVMEILNPEEDSASRFVTKINMKNVIDSLNISDEYSVMEVLVPHQYIGMTVAEVDLRRKNSINILTIKKEIQKQILTKNYYETKILGVVAAEYKFEANDVLVIFGKNDDIKKWIEKTTK
ncbi:MAG: TrkA family potassium uptake protein [Bacteroidales bacterium]|nr:TrkA family potassium uptake protein [Bacteroidales bacterium]